MSINFLFGLFIFTILFAGCKKEKASDITCGLTRLDQLHNQWELSLIWWGRGKSTWTDPQKDCLDTICSYFYLDIRDSLRYKMDYFLLVNDTEAGTVRDTIIGSETGSFQYEYCHQTNINSGGGHYPGGFSNSGEITFNPKNGSPKVLSFVSDGLYPLWLNGYFLSDFNLSANFYFKIP